MIAPLGFILTAVLFASLAILLLTVWRERQNWARLLTASGVSVAWAGIHALELTPWGGAPLPVLVADVVRAGVWYGLLGSLLGSLGLQRKRQLVMGAFWYAALALTVVVHLLGGFGQYFVKWLLVLQLLLALGGLVLVEQLLRNAPTSSRWAVKYLCFGIGLAFAFDLYLFSESVLFGALDLDLVSARGYVNVLSGLAIAVAVRRDPRLDLNLSHQMVFFLGSVLVVGAYLLLMALGGYYVRLFGGEWARIAQPTFLAGGLLVLLVLLFSDTARSRFRVFLSKNFQRYKYDYRQEWLRFTRTLAEAAGDADIRGTSIRAMAEIVASPGGVLWFADESGSVYRAVAALPVADLLPDEGVPAADPVVTFLAARRWIVDLRQLRATPAHYAELAVPPWLEERQTAWLIIPLLLGSVLVGFVVLDEAAVTAELNFEDHDLLKMVGRDVATHVSQYEASRRLAEGRQFAAYHQLSAFVMHDLKNLAAQLSLVVRNAEKHRRNPEFVDDSVATIANSVERMNRLLAQLGGGAETSSKRRVALKRVLENVVTRSAARGVKPQLIASADDLEVLADSERLSAVFEHVLNNAQDASGQHGRITVTLTSDQRAALVTVTDNGKGMEPEFVRKRLFSPFDTTKGSAGMGIGAYQVREYVRILGGEVLVRSTPGFGTTFDIRLPLA